MPERSWRHEALTHQADKRSGAIITCNPVAVLPDIRDDTKHITSFKIKPPLCLIIIPCGFPRRWRMYFASFFQPQWFGFFYYQYSNHANHALKKGELEGEGEDSIAGVCYRGLADALHLDLEIAAGCQCRWRTNRPIIGPCSTSTKRNTADNGAYLSTWLHQDKLHRRPGTARNRNVHHQSGKFLLPFEDEQNLYRSLLLSRINAKNFFDGSKCALHCYSGYRMYLTGTITTNYTSTKYLWTEKCNSTRNWANTANTEHTRHDPCSRFNQDAKPDYPHKGNACNKCTHRGTIVTTRTRAVC